MQQTDDNSLNFPKLRFEKGSKVAPGDRICAARKMHPGPGTYIRGGHIFSSVVGKLVLSTSTAAEDKEPKNVVSVELERGRQYASSQILTVGKTVLCKILRITMQEATVDVMAADEIGSLREHHGGIIRKENVRIGATEEVQIYESFRPGDFVLAKIISLGDSRRYYLSTAENDLGVIQAICSTSGRMMIPVSWREMECPDTKIREPRKCARPKDSNSSSTSAEK